jgi:Tannase and feruloyl esterase
MKTKIFLMLVLLVTGRIIGYPSFAKETTKQKEEIHMEVSKKSCANLKRVNISKTSIGLPTTGASITSARFTTDNKNGEFCKVLGSIHPVDSSAPDIQFQVNLPSNWNHKALQRGGAGLNGVLVKGLNHTRYDPINSPTPLARGYVTFGSDSGHTANGKRDGSFALNDEALVNFAGDQIKKTYDVAMTIIETYYQNKPSQIYFSGSSEGGREGLVAIQRWPQDYDGAVVLYPVYNWVTKAIQDNRNVQALYKNEGEGWISPKENTLIKNTVLSACDALDGAVDGIISHTEECTNKKEQILSQLRKAGLSTAQIEVIKTFHSPMEFDFSLPHKVDSIPGYSQFVSADIGVQFGSTRTPSSYKEFGTMGQFSDQVLRYMVTRDLNFDSLTFHSKDWKKEIEVTAKLLDATDPDLSAFKESGGKLILVHGTADQIVTPYGTVEYYKKLQNRFDDKLDQFAKFYLIPGYGHGYGAFTMSADLLGELDNWVVNGSEPTNVIAMDKNNGRTRPLCEFPTWPKYKGTGDIDTASSYSCIH